MNEVDRGSVTHWIGDLKVGDLAAAQPLWERYFGKLVVLARAKLRGLRKAGADEDEEDAALSAFNSFCEGAAKGRFPKLDDREDLWKLMVVITARKAFAQVGRERRLKRGGGRKASELDRDGGLELIAGDEPTPEFAAMVAEEFQRLLDALPDDGLREVALRRMEGYTSDEIAERLGCARRTVARRLDLIRKTWSQRDEDAS
ncbi:ECF-type sigma factor [Paludisphaera sp.]|uniref:ECF-type sigma factor n=1 Tax=Paludisphaera sp. TaxID=2017432 RepID=UPI00301DAF23